MLQQLLKYPVQVFSPAVITHPILAHHMTTHSQNHFYDGALSPTLTVYPTSYEILHTLNIELSLCSRSLVCVIITDALSSHSFIAGYSHRPLPNASSYSEIEYSTFNFPLNG